MGSTAERAPRYLSLFLRSDRFCEHGNEVKQRSILDIFCSCNRCKSPEEGSFISSAVVSGIILNVKTCQKKTSQNWRWNETVCCNLKGLNGGNVTDSGSYTDFSLSNLALL